jgi:ribosomal protein S18 acetylase RimI-like enzyme
MILAIPLTDPIALKRLLEVQKASYLVEAALIGFFDIPGLQDTEATLQACGETFFGWFGDDGELAGAIAYIDDGEAVDIHRLVVHPGFFRRGIGEALVRHVLASFPGRGFVVTTGAANLPAKRLYGKLGFAEKRTFEPVPGLLMTEFERGR